MVFHILVLFCRNFGKSFFLFFVFYLFFFVFILSFICVFFCVYFVFYFNWSFQTFHMKDSFNSRRLVEGILTQLLNFLNQRFFQDFSLRVLV